MTRGLLGSAGSPPTSLCSASSPPGATTPRPGLSPPRSHGRPCSAHPGSLGPQFPASLPRRPPKARGLPRTGRVPSVCPRPMLGKRAGCFPDVGSRAWLRGLGRPLRGTVLGGQEGSRAARPPRPGTAGARAAAGIPPVPRETSRRGTHLLRYFVQNKRGSPVVGRACGALLAGVPAREQRGQRTVSRGPGQGRPSVSSGLVPPQGRVACPPGVGSRFAPAPHGSLWGVPWRPQLTRGPGAPSLCPPRPSVSPVSHRLLTLSCRLLPPLSVRRPCLLPGLLGRGWAPVTGVEPLRLPVE